MDELDVLTVRLRHEALGRLYVVDGSSLGVGFRGLGDSSAVVQGARSMFWAFE